MENYTITKEQVLELSNSSIVIKEKLNEMFPDAFKKQLETGKWYIVNGDKCGQEGKVLIANYSGIEQSKNYGFAFSGVWLNDLSIFHKGLGVTTREAKKEEIESALINEAKKRGYKQGVKIRPVNSEKELTIASDIFEITNIGTLNVFNTNGSIQCEQNTFACLYSDGKWATIIHKIVTMDKAVKILSKKYGQKVEIK